MVIGESTQGPADPVLLGAKTGYETYTAYTNQHLYIDYSDGKPTPLGFVADNRTLSSKQTTWGFYDAEGFTLFSPKGDLSDIGPPAPGGGETVVASQGWTWIETATPSVFQLHWNQSMYLDVVAGKTNSGSGGYFGRFYGDYSPNVTYTVL